MSLASTKVTSSTFVLLLALYGADAGAQHTITRSTIARTMDGHGTTRTTVRRVFHHRGIWYVFCGDVRDRVYTNFFVTSADGITWSGRKVGSGGGVMGDELGAPNLPETAIVHDDQILGCYTEQGELRIRRGTLADGDITWTDGHAIAPAFVDGATPNFYGYYPDIVMDTDGFVSLSLRHHHVRESTRRLDPALVLATRAKDITSWQAPRDLIAFEAPERVDAHQNIPLPDGRRVVLVRSYRGETDEELYKPGWPGSFYACHFDGTRWLGAVRLGASDGINGSDKRLSAMLDPGTGIVHLTYIEDSGAHGGNELRYRTLSPPYARDDWSAPTAIATNAFTVALGMDASAVPARLVAVYGDQLHEGGEVDPTWGSRWHTGRLLLKRFDGARWESGAQQLSEPGEEYAWYPSIQQDVADTFGVLYMKAGFADFRSTPKELIFALVRADAQRP